MSKRLSPEYFKRVCETIWRHDWKSDAAYRAYFRKFMLIFDPEDVQEFNVLIDKFTNRFFFTPLDIEQKVRSMIQRQTVIRIKYQGEKYIVAPEEILKELENLIRWCHKKLNKYYIAYGINIDGIDISDIEDIKGAL